MAGAHPFASHTLSSLADLAKSKVDRLLDLALRLLRQRETNEILVYSGQVVDQIPSSFAAVTFNDLQRASLDFEFLLLGHLWDTARGPQQALDRNSIPAVIFILKTPGVVDEIVRRGREAWLSKPYSVSPTLSVDERALAEPMFERMHIQWATERSEKQRAAIAKATEAATAILESDLLKTASDYRDRVAHDLSDSATRRAPGMMPRYGDEKALFDLTREVVDGLAHGVGNFSFSWDIASENAKRCAHAFWGGVTVRVLE